MMHKNGKSDGFVVPTKQPNEVAKGAEEAVEGRSPAKGNGVERYAFRTQCRTNNAQSGLDRVREVAKRNKNEKFTALLHHVTIDRLRAAFLAVQREASPGVDGVTWDAYKVGLEKIFETCIFVCIVECIEQSLPGGC